MMVTNDGNGDTVLVKCIRWDQDNYTFYEIFKYLKDDSMQLDQLTMHGSDERMHIEYILRQNEKVIEIESDICNN